ncbi:MAG: tRNA uridine-5-carboxymethylaminomethyl(34) synthesis GTPase MnmE [Oscillospiraceae bacterium]|nr:tRNA uridine-5-carboxymethylaminomethyl(34) synthesis GTPase MnmE [Oscillospiraceae bacterium]
MFLSDTIAAIATGSLISAIGIIRISGSDAISAAGKMFRAKNGTSLKDAKSGRMYYGELCDNGSELIDLCLCTVSRAPNSYTGEDTVELHCHGSPVLLRVVLSTLFSYGVRAAKEGEFTKRAFLNGRLDLTQAEAVIDLIEAETPYGAKNAAGQLRGVVYTKMNTVYNRLVDIMAHFHAVLDYPDEDIDEFKLQDYLTSLKEIEDELSEMIKTHDRGKSINSGIRAAIIGRTNTGKSSLLNALLGYDRAIVTDIAGTTRDTIEEKIIIGNVLLRLIDTAGLRKTEDTVEKLGIDRTLEALSEAELIIIVLDGSEKLSDEDYNVLKSVPQGIPTIIVLNKSDLPTALKPTELAKFGLKYCRISALTGEGLALLDEEIQKMFPEFISSPSGEIITNMRQVEAITRAAGSIRLAAAALTAAVTPDAVLTDIEAALAAIGEVTGKTVKEDIVSRIFERFCVGK